MNFLPGPKARKLREELGATLNATSQFTGIAIDVLSRYERGLRTISPQAERELLLTLQALEVLKAVYPLLNVRDVEAVRELLRKLHAGKLGPYARDRDEAANAREGIVAAGEAIEVNN